MHLRIYVVDRKNHRFEASVQNGHQKDIDIIVKIDPMIMEDIIKGSEKRYVNFVLVSKGWFSEKIVGEGDLEMNFIKNNRMEERVVLKEDKIYLDYVICVQKPKKPIVTEITALKVSEYPKYEHNSFVEK